MIVTAKNLFFLLDQKESKNQERSYRPMQVRALLRRLSYPAPHLVMDSSTDIINRFLNLLQCSCAAGVDERCELQVLGQ
jgi:hypothetical protein